MPINVFANYSHDNNTKIDTSSFVQKPYLRTNYIESKIEEDINTKCQYRIVNLLVLVLYPISIREATSKKYVDNIFRNDVDFNDVKIEIIKFVKVNHQPAVNEHLTTKTYVDIAIDQSKLNRNNQDNAFRNYNLTNINSIL